MNIRKLLDWRKLLIYTHRWMGIFFGVIFIAWFVSGVAFMYVGMPTLSVRERLGHIKPLDLSTVRIAPAEAARKNDLEPGRFSIEMHHDGRPVYLFGTTKVYADTGDAVSGANAIASLNLVRAWVPHYASTARYDTYLEDSDQWTLQNAQRQFMPLHRIALGDPAGTYYYVSEKTGELVMKTDRRGRFWGFWSGVLHWTYFTALRRHGYLWNKLVAWGSIVGAFMCLTGIVVGVWRLGMKRRYRIKGALSHSPYAGWMRWHHYAGLIFGLLTCTWAFSGALSLTPFQFLRGSGVTQRQRRAVSGGRVNMETITVERMQASLAAFTPSFTPKEIELLQFRGKPYFIGYCPPASYDFNEEVGSNSERYAPPREHLIVSAIAPEQGTFKRFDDGTMWKIAQEAMPGVQVQDSTWLNEYDAYYYNQDGLRSLPVLRVRYADPQSTWLYLDPQHGTLSKQDRMSRLNRWLYHGFHSLDFPFLYYRRPLWDIVVIVFSIGGIALSATTLVPSWHRLLRHARRFARFIGGLYRPKRTPVAAVYDRRRS
jgi:hypothetical protein